MPADDSDIQTLLAKTEPELPEEGYEITDSTPLWQDMGGWFVVATLPLFALLFRKGFVLIFILGICGAAQAGWWEREDQKAYREQMYAVRDYRIAHYAQAEKGFAAGKKIDDLYNRGNALAFQQKIPEAIEAYRLVLKQDPNHEDARYNKEYLERQQEQNEQQQQQDQQNNNRSQENQRQQNQQQNKQPPENQHQQQQDNRQQKNDQQNDNQQSENQSPDQQDKSNSESDKSSDNDSESGNPLNEDMKQNPPESEQLPQSQDKSNETRPEDTPSQNQPPAAIDNEAGMETEQSSQPETEETALGEMGQPPLPKNNNPFNEDEKKLLNRLPKEEYNVLRYRIRQQYLRYRGK